MASSERDPNRMCGVRQPAGDWAIVKLQRCDEVGYASLDT